MVARAFGVDDKLDITGGTMSGTLTLDGTPPLVIPSGGDTGTAPVSTGSGVLSMQGIFGTRPEWFGSVSGVSGDDAAITAAIGAVESNAPGCPGPVVISQPCAIDNTVTAARGVNLAFTGQGDRSVFPDVFTGGYISPSALFPTSGVPLITVGAAGTPTVNPNGIRFFEPCLSGMTPGGTLIANCIGIEATDTTDVHLVGGFLANFDRAGATGTCVLLASASSGNGVGFETQNTIFSNSWQGIAGDGAGVTDLRLTGGLLHSCTEQITLGATAGGGGLQMTAVHATYSGMPSGGWHLNLGAQSGSYAISNCYFDQAGSATPVKLASSKGVISGNVFLAAASSTATALVRLTTANQELSFIGNSANANGSSINALLWLSALTSGTTPTGGVYIGNTVYGTAASLTGVIINGAGTPAVIPDQITYTGSGTGAYAAANRSFS
jgi:hypothetical protein